VHRIAKPYVGSGSDLDLHEADFGGSKRRLRAALGGLRLGAVDRLADAHQRVAEEDRERPDLVGARGDLDGDPALGLPF
jgi:hypothetical protein